MPEDRDLLKEPPARILALAGSGARVVIPVHLGSDPRERRDDSPTTCLGGVRGEDGMDLELCKSGRHAVAANAGDGRG